MKRFLTDPMVAILDNSTHDLTGEFIYKQLKNAEETIKWGRKAQFESEVTIILSPTKIMELDV